MRSLFQLLAGLVAIGAGVYLFSFSGGAIDLGNGQSGRSWFDVIDHGMGAYFIARGLWMLTQISAQEDVRVGINRLVELTEWEIDQAYPDEDEEEDIDAVPQPAE
jgi:hypothetical protein